MTSVFSKLIVKTSNKYGIRQEQLTKGVVGAVTALYLLKIGYPYIAAGAKSCFAQVKGSDKNVSSNNLNNNRTDDKKKSKNQSEKTKVSTLSDKNASTGKKAVGLDKIFFKQLLMLLKIMIPGWRTREAGLLTCATLALLARTFLSVYVATLEGQIVKRIVLRDINGFFQMMYRWVWIAFPATFVNSTIRYLEGQLALSFRYCFKIN